MYDNRINENKEIELQENLVIWDLKLVGLETK